MGGMKNMLIMQDDNCCGICFKSLKRFHVNPDWTGRKYHRKCYNEVWDYIHTTQTLFKQHPPKPGSLPYNVESGETSMTEFLWWEFISRRLKN